VIVLGDVHRRWKEAAETIERAGLHGRTIVQVGDFGLGFGDRDRERQQLDDLGAALSQRDNRLLVVRGNHDDPAFFRHRRELAGGAICVVPDYSVETVEGRKVLLVGGATSVDRKLRRAGDTYWPDESVVLDLARLEALDIDGLAAVVTHTAPGIAPPSVDAQGRFYAGPLPEPPARFREALRRLYAHDETLAGDILAERRALNALYQAIRARTTVPHWIYGHFHHHVTQVHDGTRFIMLHELQLLEV
jgi:UDP-2,3-diacylglucosamine pyrophosphatase LpxH